MEKSGKIEDGVMDNLLQGFIKRQMKPDSACEAFDPDLASAYLERVMTQREQTGYESHLSACTHCRKNVIALAGLLESEVTEVKVAAVAAGVPASLSKATVDAQVVKAVSDEQASWLTRLKAWFGGLATPRFALAATAALALAVVIPYVLIQNSRQSQPDVAQSAETKAAGAAAKQPSPNDKQESKSADNNPINPNGEHQNLAVAGKPQNDETKPSATPPVAGAPAAEATAPEGTATGAPGTAGKEEAVVADKVKETEAAKPTTETAGGTTQPEAAKNQPVPAERRDAPAGRIDPETARRVDHDRGNASEPTTLKPGNSTAGSSKKDAPTVRPESTKTATSQPGRSEPPPRSVSRRGQGFRDSSESNRERANASASRRIHKKTFWLVDDTWTDENYRSDKEMPIIPLIKDSDNYKNVLEKHSDLKKFFSAFGANERAIIVRKDMAYKLIPQDGNK